MEGDAASRGHAHGQVDGRNDSAAKGMAVGSNLGLRALGQKAQQMSHRRDGVAFGRAVQQRGETLERLTRDIVVGGLAAADPVCGVDGHQNDFGRPSTCVATWLRMRLVDIGAT